MTVTYDPTELGPTIEATLAIYWWNGTRWLKEPTSGWDGSAHTVTATLEHLVDSPCWERRTECICHSC